jgi:TolB protein
VIFEKVNSHYLDLYALDMDRSVQHNLVHSPLNDEAGAWSPDNQRMAFVSGRDGERHLYLMTIGESGEPRRLDAARIASGGKPAWSPDGRFIAYEVEANGGVDLYLLEVDASVEPNVNPRALTDNYADSRYPVWSPDGTRIAFVSWDTGDPEIYVIEPATMALSNLTQDRDWDFGVAWSPDGTRIAFYSDRTGARELYVMDADGANLRQITSDNAPGNGVFVTAPVWSPDGTHIAYVSGYSSAEIMTVDVETGALRRLTYNIEPDLRPTWLADGRGIVFLSARDGSWGLYQIDIVGEQTRQLAISQATSGALSLWNP